MQSTIQVQLTKDGVLIPREYLQNANSFEIEVRNGDVLIRPKSIVDNVEIEQPNKQPSAIPEEPKKSWLSGLIGIAETRDPTASSRVKEILTAEVDKRSGFTFKDPVDENQ